MLITLIIWAEVGLDAALICYAWWTCKLYVHKNWLICSWLFENKDWNIQTWGLLNCCCLCVKKMYISLIHYLKYVFTCSITRVSQRLLIPHWASNMMFLVCGLFGVLFSQPASIQHTLKSSWRLNKQNSSNTIIHGDHSISVTAA